jgi:GNAT superfamily N-acetyltransferase
MNAYEKQRIRAEAIPHPAAADKTNPQYCTVLKHLYITPGVVADYHTLARFHYRCTKLGPVAGVWVVGSHRPSRYDDGEPIAVIVYTYPAPNLAVRNRITRNFFRGPDRSAGVALLNRHVRCISRVIVDPRWRGLGLAGWLVRETMPLLNIAMIESMALMGRFHPFLENAGLRQFTPPENPKTEKLVVALDMLNIPRDIWHDPDKVQIRMDCLPAMQAQWLDRRIDAFLGRFGGRRGMMWGIERTTFVLERLAHPWTYFAWLNPKADVVGLKLLKQPSAPTNANTLPSARRGEPACSPAIYELPSGQTHRSAPTNSLAMPPHDINRKSNIDNPQLHTEFDHVA